MMNCLSQVLAIKKGVLAAVLSENVTKNVTGITENLTKISTENHFA